MSAAAWMTSLVPGILCMSTGYITNDFNTSS